MTPKVGLTMNSEALSILIMIAPYSKTMPKVDRRLARIRLNLLRELEAFNKELKRHRAKIKVDLGNKEYINLIK